MRGREVSLVGRRVVTLLGDPRRHRDLVRALDTSTPRRRAVRAALLAVTTLRALPLVSRSVGVDEATAACLRALEEQCGEVAAVMVAWPSGDRSHRRYLFATAADGLPVAFAKITTRPDVDGPSMRTEAELLRAIGGRTSTGVRVPSVLALVDTVDVVALVLEPIPSAREHLTWDEVLGLLPLAVADPSEGGHAPETPAAASDSFRSLLEAAPGSGSGLAHGDLRPSNAVRAGGETWLFDWEYGDLGAPSATDLASAVLTRRVETDDARDPQTVLDDLLADLAHRGVPAHEAARAVGYLAGTGQPWAERVVGERWPVP